ncbi:bladder cancer-associated protein-like [Tropilaelaps mercedesae]|uniref:Bladder cancer-associated protein-like n=1 Tax=Tropilaelaps mercedesae TaxID=418985 RepID=A0A1V9XR44_9ACAR|nr:bladder cancer-associated protein-like [Tropilaelaps mercedesae]
MVKPHLIAATRHTRQKQRGENRSEASPRLNATEFYSLIAPCQQIGENVLSPMVYSRALHTKADEYCSTAESGKSPDHYGLFQTVGDACQPTVNDQVMLLVLYLAGLFLDRKPCIVCSFIFVAAVLAICYSGTLGNCLFGSLNCNSVACECVSPHSHVVAT